MRIFALLIWDAVVGGTASLINGLFNSASTNKANKRTIQFAKESQQEQERFAKEMFNMENAYNDPSAVMDRLAKAGINPNAYWSEGNASAGMASGDSSISPVSPDIKPVPSPFQGMVTGNAFTALKEIYDIEQTKRQNERQGIENSYLARMYEQELKKSMSEESLNKAKTAYQNLENEGFPEYRSKELWRMEAEAYSAAASGDLAKANRLVAKFEAKAKKYELDELLPLKRQEIDENISLIKERKNTEKASQEGIRAGAAASYGSAASSYASAALSRAKTMTENDLREYVVEGQKQLNKINSAVAKQEESKAKYIDDQLATDLEIAVKSSKMLDSQKELLLQRIRYAKKENDWYEIHQIQSILNDVVDGFAKLLPTSSTKSGYKSMDGHRIGYSETTTTSRLP